MVGQPQKLLISHRSNCPDRVEKGRRSKIRQRKSNIIDRVIVKNASLKALRHNPGDGQLADTWRAREQGENGAK